MVPGFTLGAPLHHSPRHKLWQAVRQADGLAVVLKTLSADRPTRQQVAELAREHRILQRLHNAPAVVRTHGWQPFGDGNAALVLEPGGTPLAAQMRRHAAAGEAGVDAQLALAMALAEALAQLHEREVVHKNLQPRNVLVDAAGAVRLIDFRIASELSTERQGEDPARLQLHDLPYVSPEQTGRTNRELDYRSDFYSLGVTLFEMLVGSLPYQADSPLGWVHAHISQPARPPAALSPQVPAALSGIVLKLLAKNAEDRYQSSVGLIEDLSRCRREYALAGAVPMFELGRRDVSPRFRLPGRLYGREAEVAALTALFEQVAAGGTEIVMVCGASGIGKSALVGELGTALVRRQGLLVEGKFDQFQRSTPYAAVARALRKLVRQWLSEDAAAQATWRERIGRALSGNGQVMVDLVPELQTLLGPQPPVPDLPRTEAQNRFQIALVDFVRCIAAAQPLVLFIDDLQFADAATLHLLAWLATARDLPRLLLVGAYRSHEVDAGHGLSLALGQIAQVRPVHTLALQELEPASALALVADALHSERDDVEPLAALLHQRAQGNPFFLGELMSSLVTRKAIRFAPEQGRWRWNLDAVSEVEIGGNVVDLVLGHLRQLPQPTQRALQRAACIGASFDLATLAAVCDQGAEDTAAQLLPALRHHVLAPLDDDYKLVGLGVEAGLNPRYRFQHDRVQQAAYALIAPDLRPVVHLTVGRLLQRHAGERPSPEQLIDIVGHLNEGRGLIGDAAERLALARLNLRAGQLAQGSSAYEAALRCFSVGRELLPDDAWDSDHALTMALSTEIQQCSYLTGRTEDAERWLEVLLDHTRSPLESAEILAMRTRQYSTTGKMEESIRSAIMGLELLGLRFAATPDAADVRRERAAVRRHLAGRRIAELMHAPPLQDPRQQVAIRLLMEIFPAAFLSGSGQLFPYLVLRAVKLSLQHGNGPESAFAYAAYAMLLCGALDDPAQGWEFGQLAVHMNDELDDIALKSRVLYVNTMFVHHWSRHWSTMTPLFRRGLESGYQSGDLLYLAYNAQDCVIWDPRLDLEQAEREHASLMQVVRDTGYQDSFDSGSLFLQMQRCLLGRTAGPLAMDDAGFDEAGVVAGMRERHFMTGIANHHIYKAEIAWLHRGLDEALRHVRALQGLRASAMSLPQLVRLYLLTTLVWGHHLETLPADERSQAQRALRQDLQRMKRWAAHCPENFAHLHALMQAEALRRAGRGAAALAAYERSAALAREGSWQRDEALALEAAGRLLLTEARPRAAEGYLRAAHDTFERWGARCKVALLRDEFPALAPRDLAARAMDAELDLSSVMKASQVISGEIVLEALWTRTMRVMLENAGAQRGCFIVRDDGALVVEGLCQVDDGPEAPPAVRLSIDDAALALPISIITQVLQTREPVILHDARSDARFARDAYLRQQQPQSVLCTPLVRQGRFEGALYMENRVAAGVFTRARIGLMELLAAQASISIENARLYEQQQRLIQAQRRFVPREFLQSLDRRDIARVDPGENVAKVMSVMFADLRGFTPIAELLDPRGLIGLLNRYFTAMGRPIADAGGFIDGFAGDEIKALFDTGADAALAAGVGMWRALEASNEQARRHGQPVLNMGIGIATGPVVLGTVGGSERLQCSVVGDTVNLASRVEQLTKLYGARLLVAGASADALADPARFVLRTVDRVAVKGRREVVRLVQVLDAETPERRDHLLAAQPALEAALAAYRSRDFGTALAALEAVSAQAPDDAVPRLFAERCRRYREAPPPPGWDGAEHLDHK